ncbi:histidine phosphatase family protein [Bifidobacterium cuniculi]|uniref:phosphoglycerate mutase (2,3-diphosphoglycerate-dependent) n=1 Tax=Bifidobacterium cuniculi TaxID=1688 RepID=A0A087AYM5_9BIFI|nr:histidine phosphatase family protein [Bifidobacterium cuniculi]KFI63875.1 phosphoglycerate mutase [Bifidobacterium cuniculi]
MRMPMDMYVVRHGQSEQNKLVKANEDGNDEVFTQELVTVPDRSWRLTGTGRRQAHLIGRWLVSKQESFDQYLVSPYIRARETAVNMELPGARWRENRLLRERSWGEISTRPRTEFREQYPNNWDFREADPLYWRPPAGESIADVSENRVQNLLNDLSRNADGESVVMVTHGDFMDALRLTIEDLSDEQYLEMSHDPQWAIPNCTCLHYSRKDPVTGKTHGRLRFVQVAKPVCVDGKWEIREEPWREFRRQLLTNGDLLATVRNVDRHIPDDAPLTRGRNRRR